MFLTKLGCIIAILVIIYNSSPPYFPIELSRCFATMPPEITFEKRALTAFIVIILATFACIYDVDERAWHVLGFILSMSIIVVFDDANYWLIHMLGVAMLAFEFGHVAYSTKNYEPIVLAAILYGVRIPLKVGAVWLLEGQPPQRWMQYSLQIMQTGHVANPITLNIFKLCGILQWACFVSASCLF